MVSIALIVSLYLFFERTLRGKALRATAVNRLGARLDGHLDFGGGASLSFGLAAFMGALSGLLIGPATTMFYDSGFLIGLKGFVAAIFGGLASYPAAAVGALFVGLLESFGSFYASAFKEVIVFTLDPAGAAVEKLPARPPRRGGVSMRKHRPHRFCRPARIDAGVAGARVLDHAGQLHRSVHAGRDRPGAADRHRRPHLVRAGRVRRARAPTRPPTSRTTHGVSPWFTVWIGLVVTGLAALFAGLAHACACRATTCRWLPSRGG